MFNIIQSQSFSSTTISAFTIMEIQISIFKHCYSNEIDTEVQNNLCGHWIIMVAFQTVDSTVTDDATGREIEKPGVQSV